METIKKTDEMGNLGEKEMGVLRVLLLFTCVMLIAPIMSYFCMKSLIFEGMLGYENGAVSSAIGTVIIVHIIIGWYIWIAAREENTEKRISKKD